MTTITHYPPYTNLTHKESPVKAPTPALSVIACQVGQDYGPGLYVHIPYRQAVFNQDRSEIVVRFRAALPGAPGPEGDA